MHLNKRKFLHIIQKFVDGKSTPEEITFLERYFKQMESNPDGLSSLDGNTKSKIKTDLKNRINNKVSKIKSKRRLRTTFAIAASIIVIILAIGLLKHNNSSPETFVINSNEKKTITTEGQTKSLYLSDGSYVLLQPQSTLTFTEPLGDKSRTVQLQGEAYFNIQRDTLKPFTVHSGKIQTKVLGTSFFISNTQESETVSISVSSGQVAVYTQNKKLGILNKTDQMVVEKNQKKVTLKTLKPKQIEVWAPQKFHMDNMTLAEASHFIEKRWNTKINILEKTIENWQFTASFDEKDTLEEILLVISSVLGIKYEIKNNEVYVKRKDSL